MGPPWQPPKLSCEKQGAMTANGVCTLPAWSQTVWHTELKRVAIWKGQDDGETRFSLHVLAWTQMRTCSLGETYVGSWAEAEGDKPGVWSLPPEVGCFSCLCTGAKGNTHAKGSLSSHMPSTHSQSAAVPGVHQGNPCLPGGQCYWAPTITLLERQQFGSSLCLLFSQRQEV